jgi:hypothetical protein
MGWVGMRGRIGELVLRWIERCCGKVIIVQLLLLLVFGELSIRRVSDEASVRARR